MSEETKDLETTMVQHGIRYETEVHIGGGTIIPVYVIAAVEVSEGDEVTGEVIEVLFMVGLRGDSMRMKNIGYLHPEKLTFSVLFSEKWYEVLLEATKGVVDERVPDAVRDILNSMTVAEYRSYIKSIPDTEY